MKTRNIIAAALLLFTASAASAQGVKVYTHDGQVIDYPYANLDSIVAYGSGISAPAGAQAVDLGLPSGTKWANMNVGATTAEGYGDYYQWGETTPCNDVSEDCGWNSSYTPGGTSFGGSGSSDCGTDKDPMFVDGVLTVDSAGNCICDFAGNAKYDAATANWGSAWLTPTKEQQDELRNNCDWTWTTLNGINGYEVKSKTNGNSIFLPASGNRNGKTLNFQGTTGFYWSSTVYPKWGNANYLDFYSFTKMWSWNYRYFGQSVRPVAK